MMLFITTSQFHASKSLAYLTSNTQRKRIQIHAILSPEERDPGVECLLFHGTERACLLGEEESQTNLCQLRHCKLCSIIRNSFDVKLCGSHHKFSRYVIPISLAVLYLSHRDAGLERRFTPQHARPVSIKTCKFITGYI